MNRCKTIFSCLPCVLSNFCQYTIYALSTNDEVKDDWVVNMVNNSARKNEANIHLSRWNRRKKPKRQKIKLYFAGRTREIPSIQDRPILPSRVANQNTGTGVSTIKSSLIMKIILVPNKSSFSTGIPPLPTTSSLSTANSSLSASTGSTPASPSNQLQLQKINNESFPYWAIGVTVVALGIIIFAVVLLVRRYKRRTRQSDRRSHRCDHRMIDASTTLSSLKDPLET